MLKENRSLLHCIRIAATSQCDKLIGCELVFLKAASPGVVDEPWRQAVQAALPGKSQVRVAQC